MLAGSRWCTLTRPLFNGTLANGAEISGGSFLSHATYCCRFAIHPPKRCSTHRSPHQCSTSQPPNHDGAVFNGSHVLRKRDTSFTNVSFTTGGPETRRRPSPSVDPSRHDLITKGGGIIGAETSVNPPFGTARRIDGRLSCDALKFIPHPGPPLKSGVAMEIVATKSPGSAEIFRQARAI